MCARLEGDSPMVEEFELPLRPAAGRDIWRGTSLVTTAQFTSGFFWLLSHCLYGGGVRLDVLCTNASSSYMMWQCFCLLFQKKSLDKLLV